MSSTKQDEAGGHLWDTERKMDEPTTTVTIGATKTTGQLVQLPVEVLTIVVSKLEKKGLLLRCRQVNSTWRKYINPILRQKLFDQPLQKINFGHLTSSNQQLENLFRLTASGSIDLEKMFGSIDSFPLAQVNLSRISLEDQKVQNFFDLYGSFIVSLELHDFELKIVDGQPKSLNHLLMKQTPNLKSLLLDTMTIKSDDHNLTFVFDDNVNKIEFPHLQRLVLINQGHLPPSTSSATENLLEKIIMGGKNLKHVALSGRPQTSFFLNMLAYHDKLHILKQIDLSVDPSNIKVCLVLATNLLLPANRLESINCQVDSGGINNLEFLQTAALVINKVMESSKNSLMTFDRFHPLGWIPGINFPVMNKVTKVNIGMDGCYGRPLFPPGLILSKVFPNVTQVDLTYTSTNWTAGLFPSHLDTNNKWPSVQKIKIGHHLENLIEELSRLFPNLKKLVINCSRVHLHMICPQIFEYMKQLEWLEFLQPDCTNFKNSYWLLDPIFTGLSWDLCRQLAASLKENEVDNNGGMAEKVGKLRRHSILNLTGLKSLRMTGVKGFGPFILSTVSGLWAFKLMPSLKVTITAAPSPIPDENIRIQSALDSITPFVHWSGFEEK